MFSKRLKMELDLELCEPKNAEDKKLTVVRHDSFVDVIYNICEKSVSVSTFPIKVENDWIIAKCKINDQDGTSVEGIGEIKGYIAPAFRKNPYILATNMAFDRAAKLYLQLEQKVYSNLEIDAFVDSKIPDAVVAKEVDDELVEAAEAETEEAVIEDVTDTSEPEEVVVEDEVFEEPAPAEPAKEKTKAPGKYQRKAKESKPAPADTNSEAPNGDMKMFGKYKGKTLAEAYEICKSKNDNWLEWISNNHANKEIREKVKSYIAAREG